MNIYGGLVDAANGKEVAVDIAGAGDLTVQFNLHAGKIVANAAGAVKVGKKDLTLINDHSDDHRVEDAKIVAQFWKESYDRKATDAMAKQYGINSPYHANAIIGRAGRGETTEVSIYAASIGGLGFVFAPYEMFCNNGIFIKKNAPKDVTIVATCANAGCGYLADDFAFEDQCYEVDTRKFERGTAEKVASAFVELLTQL